MQTTPVNNDFCEINIYPAHDLSFNVRVSLHGKSYLKGGFMNPNEAERHGLKVMLTMTNALPVQ